MHIYYFGTETSLRADLLQGRNQCYKSKSAIHPCTPIPNKHLRAHWDVCSERRTGKFARGVANPVLKEKAAYSLIEGEEIDNIPFTDTAEHLERRLVPLTQLEPLSNQTQGCSIYVLFGYAALIHLYLFIRDCSKDLPFSHLLSRRIRTVLERVDTQHLETQFPEMMLWIFIMGGLSGSPSLERVWFANRTAYFCSELGLCGGDQIKYMLDHFLWSEVYRSPVTERFWTEVAKAQGSVVGYEVHRMVDCVSLVHFNAPADVDDSI